LINKHRGVTIAIDASRNRSGGALAHIIGILSSVNPDNYGIIRIHLWGYKVLLDKIPDYDWLVKHNPDSLEKGLLSQVLWQRFNFQKELKLNKCDILLSTDAGTLCRFKPAVVMSRDMLSFEFKEMERYKGTLFWMRLKILQYLQISSLKYATGVLFLTDYAKNIITKDQNFNNEIRVIPHGISDNFRFEAKKARWENRHDLVKCVYISNADLYKHQWHVIEAFKILRDRGYNTSIDFVGANNGRKSAIEKILSSKTRLDPENQFSNLTELMTHDKIPVFLRNSDIFVFASSCENMPNTLIEGMAAGLPVCSSSKGPMQEILKNSGMYFDPEDPVSIADSIQKMIDNPEMCSILATQSKEISNNFSWKRCADETFKYLVDIIKVH
jgi:glycosyltransferase involved in cell wall biosynthesis